MKVTLFNEASRGNINVHDSNNKIINIPIRELKFRVSVYGILKENNKLLVTYNPLINQYNIPGGGVELGENLANALNREFREESGIEVGIVKLLDVKEDFFAYHEEYAHSILIFYEVKQTGGVLMTESNGEDSEKVEYLTLEKIRKVAFPELFLTVLEESLK